MGLVPPRGRLSLQTPQPMPHNPRMTALTRRTSVRDLGVSVERVFDVVVAEDVLPLVLHRWGPIPAVTGTRDLTGPWDTPGSERTVLLGDGNTAHETVLVWDRPHRFEYRVDSISGPFGRFVDHAIGTWVFAPTATGSSFRWTYAFTPRGPVASVPLAVITHTAWARYMEQCAHRSVDLATAVPRESH
jgi:hypothetical protein